MNYRHAFHAGNFADLLKHAALLWLLDRLQAAAPALTVIDTHAGAGFYELSAGGKRSPEAEAGVARLMDRRADAPAALTAMAAALDAVNPDGEVRFYPGSPWLVAERLRADDRLIACELRAEEHALLAERLADFRNAQAVHADGYDAARAASGAGRRLVLIDPPFERPDDHVRCADTAQAIVAARPDATVAIWLPLKDLETFDGFLRRFDAALALRITVVELRLRPLTDPMRMNGCAVVVLNAPSGMTEAIGPVCDWLARGLGDAGARGEVWPLA